MRGTWGTRLLVEGLGSWFPTHSAKDAEWMGHPGFWGAGVYSVARRA